MDVPKCLCLCLLDARNSSTSNTMASWSPNLCSVNCDKSFPTSIFIKESQTAFSFKYHINFGLRQNENNANLKSGLAASNPKNFLTIVKKKSVQQHMKKVNLWGETGQWE